ncbi:MAG TPA: GNAT family N-acetyltransferase [Candidatus Excrementavichristensenella intestinipullorum]|nr:GNAT family N-acetyltransferase [Candidatus Excrementavichristensenella intestinipullorum]
MGLYPDQVFDQMRYLETHRLVLRRMTMRDAQDMYEYSRDPQVARHVLWDAHRSLGETRSYIRSALRRYRAGQAASLVIELKAERKVIGTIGFMWYQQDNSSAEVGYSLSRAYWNRGIMTEALGAVVDFAFRQLRINRLEAQHEVDNPASGQVMRNVGMVKEGTLRQRLFNKGRYVDVDLYAILREDFLKRETKTQGGASKGSLPFDSRN